MTYNVLTITVTELMESPWCIDQIKNKNGSIIELPQIKPIMRIEGNCIHKLNFNTYTFELSSLAFGKWKYLDQNKIQLIDTNETISGVYSIKTKPHNAILYLESETYLIILSNSSNRKTGSKIIFNLENRRNTN